MLCSLASILDFMLMHHDRLVIEILGSLDDLIAQPTQKYFHPISFGKSSLRCAANLQKVSYTLLF